MKPDKQNYLDILYILLHIVANLCEISLHALGVLIVDDVYQFAEFFAYLCHLSAGVRVEQYLLQQIVVLVEHSFGYAKMALECCARRILMLHDGREDKGAYERRTERIGHRFVMLLECVLVDVETESGVEVLKEYATHIVASVMMMAFSSDSCPRLANVGPNIG